MRAVGTGAGALLAAAVLVAGCALGPRPVSDALTPDEHNDLGVAYYARGDYAGAAREFGHAAAARPGWARALTNLGDAELARGAAGAAIAAYEAALRTAPRDPAVANNLAWVLLRDPARWPDAEPLIRRALALDPEPRGYYLDTLGVLLLKKDEWSAALAAFRGALADPGVRDEAARALILRHTADALARLGRTDAATRCEGLAASLAGRGAEAAGPSTGAEVGDSEPVC